MFPRCAMILLADSHDVSLVKNIIVVIIISSGSEVHWFKPGRGRLIFFQSVKILSMTSFGREVKPCVPCRSLRHVNEPQAEIRASEQNLSDFSRSMT